MPDQPAPRGDYSGHDLTEVDWSGQDLLEAKFQNAILTRAKLYGADLRRADFTDASLLEANLTGPLVDAPAPLFSVPSIPASPLEAPVEAPDQVIRGANLEGATLSRTVLAGADLTGANLHKANLSDSLLSNVDLKAFVEDLTNDVMKGRSIWPTEAGAAKISIAQRAQRPAVFVNAVLTEAKLCRVDALGVDFSGARLRLADVQDAYFQRANLSGADLHGAQLSRTRLDDARLNAAQLAVAALDKTNLSNAECCKAIFTGANLAGANLFGANLTDATFQGADLTGASLQSANCTRTDFAGANLTNANLSGANLSNAFLTGTDLTRANLGDFPLSWWRWWNISFVLDRCLLNGTRLPRRAADPWTKLRRTYSGPSLIFLVLFTAVALISPLSSIVLWSSVSWAEHRTLDYAAGVLASSIELVQRMQLGEDQKAWVSETEAFLKELETTVDQSPEPLRRNAERALSLVEKGLTVFHAPEGVRAGLTRVRDRVRALMDGRVRSLRVWQLIIGVDAPLWQKVLLSALILYNLLRAFLTYSVGPMRDDQDATNVTPAQHDYWRYWQFHKWVAVPLGTVSIVYGLARLVSILRLEVIV